MTEREKMLAGEVYDACDPELLEDLNRVSASRQFLRDHDTEDIPEMANIKDIDIAFLPCNQPYTMTPEQVIKVAKIIRPKVLFPYHVRSFLEMVHQFLSGMESVLYLPFGRREKAITREI